MTALVAVLNKTAVALAADSAVSIVAGDHPKIYNSVNKLFTLSKYDPVSVMIYGTAEFMGIPWETIIKDYRNYLGEKSFPEVSDYAEDFISYIQKDKNLFPPEYQLYFFGQLSRSILKNMVEKINSRVKKEIDKSKSITEIKIRTIAKNVVNVFDEKMSSYNDLDRPIFNVSRVPAAYVESLDRAFDETFQSLPVGMAIVNKAKKVVVKYFCKGVFHINVLNTGVVVSGFGKSQTFPQICSYHVECLINGRLKFRCDFSEKISRDNRGMIIPFAQSEMVSTFMDGVDPEFGKAIRKWIGTVFDGLIEGIPNAIYSKNRKRRERIQNALATLRGDVLKEFSSTIKEYTLRHHNMPVMRAVSSLPKEELAEMAESLVNLTSFKRKMSLDDETVGGPIDVAVISKGDGFIWIKRKHYFKQELNQHFLRNYFRNRA